MDLQLAGKVAVVTGSSTGLGKAMARRLAAEGADVVVTSRDLARAEAAAKELEGPGRTLAVAADTTQPASLEAMTERVAAELGGVDILVNSASAVSGNRAEDFAGITDDLILESFEEKFLGIVRLARLVVPGMQERGWGRIINIAGHKAREAGAIAAGARNAAVVHLTRTLARELGRSGITVNAVLPFTTVTETLESRMASVASRRGVTTGEHIAYVAQRTALGRLVTADEVANWIAFLASPLSVAMTGEVVAVTGGVDTAVHL